MSAVPTVYSSLSDKPVDADIRSLRFAIVGASTLPPAVSMAFTAHTGVPLLEGYGLSEATCATARNLPGHPRHGSVGQRLPYQHVKVVEIDADSGEWSERPLGQSGVLAVSGPTVFAGYVVGHGADGPVLDTLGKVRDGWLDTGDLARVDADGFLYLAGRAKDVIIRGGHNIDPVSIENSLLNHPDVAEAQAVGRPDPYAGEIPIAYVTLRTGSTATPGELTTFAAGAVPEPAAAPRQVIVLDKLPVTAIGKPDKLALRRHATERAAADALARAAIEASVDCDLIDGELIVGVRSAAPKNSVAAVLDRFAIRWWLR
jgi:fatty-acyl-CoA synthase